MMRYIRYVHQALCAKMRNSPLLSHTTLFSDQGMMFADGLIGSARHEIEVQQAIAETLTLEDFKAAHQMVFQLLGCISSLGGGGGDLYCAESRTRKALILDLERLLCWFQRDKEDVWHVLSRLGYAQLYRGFVEKALGALYEIRFLRCGGWENFPV